MVVDGNDILAVIQATWQAADRARNGEGPTLLEMKTFRMRGHEEASGTKYVPQELLDNWAKKDPVEQFAQYLRTEGLVEPAQLKAIDEHLLALIDEAAEFALAAPVVETTPEKERAGLFASFSPPNYATRWGYVNSAIH